MGMEVTHLLKQADTIGLVPRQVRRFLVDEEIAGGDHDGGGSRRIVVAPKVGVRDLECLVGGLEEEVVGKWVKKGERAGWEVLERVRVGCEVEKVLEREYWRMKKRPEGEKEEKKSGKERTKMVRSVSVGL